MASKPNDNKTSMTYRDSGVDIDAGNTLVSEIKPFVKATERPGVVGNIGGFGGLFDLKAINYKDPVLVAATDGVGTKLKIAIETGACKTIGIDLVAMCVNDLIVQGAEPLFFLDYYATGQLNVDSAKDVIEGIADGCRQANAALIGGETAEMPGMYQRGDFDLAGFCVGAVERTQLLPRKDMSVGDCIIALPSSGIHSNGYSLVRRLIEREDLAWSSPAPWQNDTACKDALLTPTKIYVSSVLASLRSDCGADIRALAHITGGGLSENIPRVLPEGLAAEIDLSSWLLPPVFSWLAKAGGLAKDELLRTFNCGLGMIVVTSKNSAEEICETFRMHDEQPIVIGRIVSGDGSKVSYAGSLKGMS